MLSSTACKRCWPASSSSTLVAWCLRKASAIRPKRRVSWLSSAAWVTGNVTSKLPLPSWSAALAKASIGWPKRRAMLCAVIKPSTNTTNPIRPSTPLTSKARSRVRSSLRVIRSNACL
ncbi:hypothetical protein D3C79_722210 [compost metagenome]